MTRRYITYFLPVALAAVFAAGLYGWREYHRRLPDTAGLRASASKNAMDLLHEFETDENYANRQYNDKVIRVTGRVVKIEQDDGTQEVLLGQLSSVGGILCRFGQPHAQEKKVKPGEEVTIKGVCTGMLMDVILVRCVLE